MKFYPAYFCKDCNQRIVFEADTVDETTVAKCECGKEYMLVYDPNDKENLIKIHCTNGELNVGEVKKPVEDAPPPLGINVRDGVGAKDRFGG